jgi:hypothetical protein
MLPFSKIVVLHGLYAGIVSLIELLITTPHISKTCPVAAAENNVRSRCPVQRYEVEPIVPTSNTDDDKSVRDSRFEDWL